MVGHKKQEIIKQKVNTQKEKETKLTSADNHAQHIFECTSFHY